jgi:signal transduction histidine kinase
MTSHNEETRLQARFLSSMDHELRAPLNAIIGLGEILADGMAPNGRRQREFAGQIVANARRLLQLIKALLELSRADAGELQLIRQPADLAELVADAVRLTQPLAARRGVGISTDLAGAPARVKLDASRIMHALHGLLTGAVHLAPEGRKVALRVTPDGEDRVRLEVTGLDIGPGHTGEFIVPSPGTWLGLALARSIVEAHGGSVGITNVPGRGRVLHAVLPGVVRQSAAVATSEAEDEQ